MTLQIKSGSLQKMECPVCLDVYDERKVIPMALPCGHAVCIFCKSLVCIVPECMSSTFVDKLRATPCLGRDSSIRLHCEKPREANRAVLDRGQTYGQKSHLRVGRLLVGEISRNWSHHSSHVHTGRLQAKRTHCLGELNHVKK